VRSGTTAAQKAGPGGASGAACPRPRRSPRRRPRRRPPCRCPRRHPPRQRPRQRLPHQCPRRRPSATSVPGLSSQESAWQMRRPRLLATRQRRRSAAMPQSVRWAGQSLAGTSAASAFARTRRARFSGARRSPDAQTGTPTLARARRLGLLPREKVSAPRAGNGGTASAVRGGELDQGSAVSLPACLQAPCGSHGIQPRVARHLC